MTKDLARVRFPCIECSFPIRKEDSLCSNCKSKQPLSAAFKQDVRYFTKACIKKGYIKKEPCAVCRNELVHAHHLDYSKPLDIMWLCREHHHDIHHKK